MTDLVLDRIEIEDVGANPARLAQAIHAQLGPGSGPVPVGKIAVALDIREIRTEPLRSFEGALVTPPERGYGSILVNRLSSRPRRRFTVAHELGHFLSPHHLSTRGSGFACSREDFHTPVREDQTWYQRQEAEANAFAIELLAPRDRLTPHLYRVPDLGKALSLSDELGISREAAVRRYVELHSECLAVVFSQNGNLAYVDRQDAFPALSIRRGTSLPELPGADMRLISDAEEVEPDEWLAKPDRIELTAQVLHQRDGRATILLHASRTENQEQIDRGVEDAYSWYSKFSRR